MTTMSLLQKKGFNFENVLLKEKNMLKYYENFFDGVIFKDLDKSQRK